MSSGQGSDDGATVKDSLPTSGEAPAPNAADASAHETRRDVGVALRNALKLGSSLLATWAVGLYVQFDIPRQLGPERYGGSYCYAEAFTSAVFVVCSLGLDTYIQKSVSANPRHASDFFGTMLTIRGVLSAFLLGGMFLYHRAVHPGQNEMLAAVMVYGATQVFLTLNASLGALLQSATKVGRLAVSNVVTKLLWGGGVIVALHFHAPVWVVILPMLLTEIFKSCVLGWVVRGALDLRLTIDFPEARRVLWASGAFFVNTAAFTIGGQLDMSMMKDLSSGEEAGWYGAAKKIANVSTLLSPVVGAILMPLLTRARARSDEEFFTVLRRSTEAVMVGAIPVTMMLSVGADVWIHILYRKNFDPAISTLRVLAPSFVLTYMNVQLANALILFDRGWQVTLVSIGSLVLQPFLITLMVRFGAEHLGVGGAGLANAFVFSFLELFSVMGFAFYLGRRAVDARCMYAIFGSLGAFAAVALLDRRIVGLGPARLVVDAVFYTILIFVTRAVRVQDVRAVLAIAMERRRARATGG